jgi:hypothetical protein
MKQLIGFEPGSVVIRCRCGSEALVVEPLVLDDTSKETVVTLSMWDTFSDSPSLWERLRMAWRVLTTGRTTTQELLFHEDEVQALIEALCDVQARYSLYGKRRSMYAG